MSSAVAKRVGVIGAGPAGMTAAYQLAKEGCHVHVFEASPFVGGMARTFELWGQRVDLGPHRFFSSDARVNRLWLEVVGRDYKMVDRLTRIYYQGKFFHYPLQAADALKTLGLLEAARCVASYGQTRLRPPSTLDTFEDWVVSRFGKRLFEIFFRTYSEKLWGITCRELDSDFAAQRIKKLSLFEAAKAALVGGGNKHKTLVDRFAYPIDGTGAVYERMADNVKERGGIVDLRTPVKRAEVHPDGAGAAIWLEDGTKHEFDYVVSSMPLTLLVERLPNVPEKVLKAAQSLTFRNTILIYLNVAKADAFRDQWLYIHSRDLDTGRITNFRNWVPELYGKERTSIMAMEYWCNDDDALWKEDDESLIAKGKRELKATGLIGDAPISDGKVIRVRRCYPVYRKGYKASVDVLVEYLRTLDRLIPIGRYGAFKYNNQDHSILMGLLAAENIALGKKHDLWDVNTDYDSYQEAAVIDETGLVPSLAGA